MIDEALRAAGLPALPRSAWLEIDQDALAGNLAAVRSLVGPNVAIAAVVKSDGYGHGLEVTARTFVAAGADRLCVATLDEALHLRTVGIHEPILVLFAIPPSRVDDAVQAGLDLVASDHEILAETLDRLAATTRPGQAIGFHLEVETGLGRAGIVPEAVPDIARRIGSTANAELSGLWSHLASPEDVHVSAAQRAQLHIAATALRNAGQAVPPIHLSASGGLFAGTGELGGMVRPGLCLYGELDADLPIAGEARTAAAALRPAMALRCRALRILEVPTGTAIGYGGRWRASRPSRIATLPVGYGDGFARAYQPGGEALVRGRRVPIVGTVAMDAVAADVTEVAEATMADEFTLLGVQGADRITADELARTRTTISWEVLASMAYRLPRVYHSGPGLTGVRTLGGEILARGRSQPAGE